MNIEQNKSLQTLTTWRLNHTVKYYTEIKKMSDLEALRQHPMFKDNSIPKIIIGKGANSLFSDSSVNAFVIVIDIKGKKNLKETQEHSYWEIMAGEDWCDLVDFFVFEKKLAGIENLALIPGKVGAAPIQNIAAYGQGFEDVCEKVNCYNLQSGEMEVFTFEDCQFTYRNSFFKKNILEGKKDLIVVSVVVRLNKIENINTKYESNYESLQSVLEKYGKAPYSIQQVCNAVKEIRRQKLPSIEQYGTNGSLFMNPIVDGGKLIGLLEKFPDLQFYHTEKMQHDRLDRNNIQPTALYKIAAGHIFEKIGWRYKNKEGKWQAKIINDVGVWHQHSLVLVNYGTLEPLHIIEYIKKLSESFHQHTGIQLIPEINIF